MDQTELMIESKLYHPKCFHLIGKQKEEIKELKEQLTQTQQKLDSAVEALNSLEMIKTEFIGNCVYSFRCYDMGETYTKLIKAKAALANTKELKHD